MREKLACGLLVPRATEDVCDKVDFPSVCEPMRSFPAPFSLLRWKVILM